MSNERDGGAHAGTSCEGSTLLELRAHEERLNALRARRIDLEVERIVAESELRAVRAGSVRDIPGASAGTVVDALDRLRGLESTRAVHVAFIDTGTRSHEDLLQRLQIASDRPRIVGFGLTRSDRHARTDNEPDNDHTNTPSTTQIGRLFHLSFFGADFRQSCRLGFPHPKLADDACSPAQAPSETCDLRSIGRRPVQFGRTSYIRGQSGTQGCSELCGSAASASRRFVLSTRDRGSETGQGMAAYRDSSRRNRRARAISRYGVRTDIDAPAVRRSD